MTGFFELVQILGNVRTLTLWSKIGKNEKSTFDY